MARTCCRSPLKTRPYQLLYLPYLPLRTRPPLQTGIPRLRHCLSSRSTELSWRRAASEVHRSRPLSASSEPEMCRRCAGDVPEMCRRCAGVHPVSRRCAQCRDLSRSRSRHWSQSQSSEHHASTCPTCPTCQSSEHHASLSSMRDATGVPPQCVLPSETLIWTCCHPRPRGLRSAVSHQC